MLRRGDKCPICGRPIETGDPNKLIFLSAIGWYQTTIEAPNGSSDYCGGSDTGATNADKIRSLPDEELYAVFATSAKNWLKAPYTGRDNEKKS